MMDKRYAISEALLRTVHIPTDYVRAVRFEQEVEGLPVLTVEIACLDVDGNFALDESGEVETETKRFEWREITEPDTTTFGEMP